MAKKPTKANIVDRGEITEQRRRHYGALQSGKSSKEAAAVAQQDVERPTAPHPFRPEPAPLADLVPAREERAPTVELAPASHLRPIEGLPDARVGLAGEAREPDDLTKIHGVGSGTVKRLRDMGVTSFVQIADWAPEEALRIDRELGLRGRIAREGWSNQARQLCAVK